MTPPAPPLVPVPTGAELAELGDEVVARLGVVVLEIRDLVTAVDRLALAVRALAAADVPHEVAPGLHVAPRSSSVFVKGTPKEG